MYIGMSPSLQVPGEAGTSGPGPWARGDDPNEDKSTTMTTPRLQTHVSIDTADLAASTAFYRALLGAEPAVVRHDYARFDVAEPALVLGLNAVSAAKAAVAGPLEHLGIRFSDDASLASTLERLAASGQALDDEGETECCYARMERSWAVDPSGIQWELFVARESVVEAPSRAGKDAACCEPSCCSPTAP
jgi:catechol 2,3-dioxygenase-like lactoylglutathione lyase family enzyme